MASSLEANLYHRPENTFESFSILFRPSDRRLMEYLLKTKDGDYLTSIAKKFGISEETASSKLRRLEKQGKVISEKSKVGTRSIKKYKINPEIREKLLKELSQ